MCKEKGVWYRFLPADDYYLAEFGDDDRRRYPWEEGYEKSPDLKELGTPKFGVGADPKHVAFAVRELNSYIQEEGIVDFQTAVENFLFEFADDAYDDFGESARALDRYLEVAWRKLKDQFYPDISDAVPVATFLRKRKDRLTSGKQPSPNRDAGSPFFPILPEDQDILDDCISRLRRLLSDPTLSAKDIRSVAAVIMALERMPTALNGINIDLSIVQKSNDETSFYQIVINDELFSLSSGGSKYDPAVGSDSYSSTAFEVETWGYNTPRQDDRIGAWMEGFQLLINLGAKVSILDVSKYRIVEWDNQMAPKPKTKEAAGATGTSTSIQHSDEEITTHNEIVMEDKHERSQESRERLMANNDYECQNDLERIRNIPSAASSEEIRDQKPPSNRIADMLVLGLNISPLRDVKEEAERNNQPFDPASAERLKKLEEELNRRNSEWEIRNKA
jgi:hypothetical protein